MWNLNKQEFSGKLFLTALCEERRKRADSVENRMKYMGKENERKKSRALWDGKRERKNSVGKERKVLTQEGGCGNISHALSKQCVPDHARVVELVDSLASGASARKGVRVRLPPRAPKRKTSAKADVFLFGFRRPAVRGPRVPPPPRRLHLAYFRPKRPNVKFCCLKQRAVFPYNRIHGTGGSGFMLSENLKHFRKAKG